MRRFLFLAAASTLVVALSTIVSAQQISGDYVETRSADVYTGSCFANSEVGLVGDQAILAWHVNKGDWQGVSLQGLSVVGVVKASATLGDPYGDPYPANAVLIVDQRATPEQRAALVSMAQDMSGKLLRNVIRLEQAPIQMDVEHQGGHYGKVVLRAGNMAGITTRLINEKDHICGNETAYYSPLASLIHSMPAVAELDQYTGPGLGVSWTTHGKRSAFVGSFGR
jgi:uncharacterized protein DUF1326